MFVVLHRYHDDGTDSAIAIPYGQITCIEQSSIDGKDVALVTVSSQDSEHAYTVRESASAVMLMIGKEIAEEKDVDNVERDEFRKVLEGIRGALEDIARYQQVIAGQT